MAAIEQNMEKLSLGMVAVANDHSLLATTHEQMNRLGELHWEDRVIGPMVNQLFPIVDLVIGYRAASREKAENSPLKAVLSMLQDFFGTYGIEPYWPRGETKFDASLMKVVKVVPTSEEKLHNQVQVCLQAGFRRGRRVLRPSSVALWRYEAKPDQPQEHCNEGRV
jgi:molecular chaperone GrpE (heat shock protein)